MNRQINDYLQNYPDIQLSTNALKSIKRALTDDLLAIAQRTLVWDVHDVLKRALISSPNKKEELTQYLKYRFATSEKTELFFLEYPTLSRLLSDRVYYFIQNLCYFFDSLLNSSKELADTFLIQKPYFISNLQFTNGDSHNLGQRPLTVDVNQNKLVFKFHSGQNLIIYNKILSYIENLKKDFTIFKTKCVSNTNYCFEEYVTYKSCNSNSEIISYYTNYGYLVALLHFLGTTDIHMENLIAHDSSPVLIDTETLLSFEERRIYSNNYTKTKLAESDSAVLSGLLPMQKYWKRQLDVSALNGMTQKLPYKVRQLRNENSSEIMYRLEEALLPPAQNIPLLDGKEIPYNNYSEIIENSYLLMISILSQNSNKLFAFCKQLFLSTEMRVLLRDTQDYHNFISFSTHPSCMVNYIEREKIFENLWSHSFITSSVVELEVASLLKHDIPYFYSSTTSTKLSSMDNHINTFFSTNIMQVFSDHITALNPKHLHISHLLLKESINILEFEYKEYDIPHNNPLIISPLLKYACDIGDQIVSTIEMNKDAHLVIWPNISADPPTNLSITFPDDNIYDGSAGILIYLSLLNSIFPKSQYLNAIEILEYEVFNCKVKSTYHSAYWGYGLRITVAYILYRFTKKDKYKKFLENSLNELCINITKVSSTDWLYGSSSLITLLGRIYKESLHPLAHKALINLVDNYKIPDVPYPGFAHGYAGMLYALTKIQPLLTTNSIYNKIEKLFYSLKETLHNFPLNDSWCNGTTGINKAFSSYCTLHNLPEFQISASHTVTESCLCHGEFGALSYIIDKFKNNLISYQELMEQVEYLIQKPLILRGDKSLIPIGLFTGLSGIGYQLLLLMFPNDIINILYL